MLKSQNQEEFEKTAQQAILLLEELIQRVTDPYPEPFMYLT